MKDKAPIQEGAGFTMATREEFIIQQKRKQISWGQEAVNHAQTSA